jgi:hypothetical protein
MLVAGLSFLVAAVFAFPEVFWFAAVLVTAVFVFSEVFPQPASAKIPREISVSNICFFILSPIGFRQEASGRA